MFWRLKTEDQIWVARADQIWSWRLHQPLTLISLWHWCLWLWWLISLCLWLWSDRLWLWWSDSLWLWSAYGFDSDATLWFVQRVFSIRASERRRFEDWRFNRSINSRLLAAGDSAHLMYLLVSLFVISVILASLSINTETFISWMLMICIVFSRLVSECNFCFVHSWFSLCEWRS